MIALALAVAVAAVAPCDKPIAVNAPNDPPSGQQQAIFNEARHKVSIEHPEDVTPVPLNPTSGALNVEIARYCQILQPRTEAQSRGGKATRRTRGQYVTLYRRCLRAPARVCVAGYNLMHGIRYCRTVHGKRTCHRRAARQLELRRRIAHYRHSLRHRAAYTFPQYLRPILARLRACESSNNYRAYGLGRAAGHYGAYQFDLSTWASVGGHGNPVNASHAEQDYRAALLWQRRGNQAWECKV